MQVEQSAPRVPVFSPPHNGGSRVENLWIMRSLTQGHAHTHTHARTLTHTAHTCSNHPIYVKLCYACAPALYTHNIMIMKVLQCYYYGKLLLPLSSPPPLCSPALLSSSHISTPLSSGELGPEASSRPANEAIRWSILSSQPNGITAMSLFR